MNIHGDAIYRLAKAIHDDRLREAAQRRLAKAVVLAENGVTRKGPRRASTR